MPNYRVAVLTHNISHFEAPFYRALALDPSVELTIYYHNDIGVVPRFDSLYGRVIDWGVPIEDGFHTQFFQHPRKMLRTLVCAKYDVLILYGYAEFAKLAALVVSRLIDTRVIFRGTGTRLDPEPPIKKLVKRIILSAIFSQCSAFLVGGKYNSDYYRYYGVPDKKMFFVPFSVDLEHFETGFMNWRDKRAQVKSELGLKDGPVALFVGTLIPKKGPDIFLQAAEKCLRAGERVSFLIVGDGAMRPELEKYVMEHEMTSAVTFTGFVPQPDLPRLYAVSDFAVFPSRYQETWARAVNEAMTCALPIIASTRVGATGDIVQDSKNGFVVKDNDPDALTVAMLKLFRDDNLREKMGAASRRIIANWDYRSHIPAVMQAIRFATST